MDEAQGHVGTGTGMLVRVTADLPPSALDRALQRVGDRWSLLVVAALLRGPGRFADLAAAVPGIATNVLSQRLKHLEGERLVLAVRYSERPVRYAYELTEAGRSLAGTLRLLAQWSSDHGDPDGLVRPPVHDACGTPVEASWWCPTCDQRIEDEADGSRWL